MLPSFETERLIVRPRSLADLEDCLVMDRDPDVTRFIPGPWQVPDEHRAFVLARMTADYPAGMGYWAVVARDRPAVFLGWVLLLHVEDRAQDVEIGWRFNRASWGHGYATEAAAIILQHALETLKLPQIIADIDAENSASIRVAEKLGMYLAEDTLSEGHKTKFYRIGSSDIISS